MRAGLSTIQQTLTPEAASVLNHSIAEAGRRNHGQTTPLHVAATLLASPSGFLRQACVKSHPNSSHPLQCRALELCFSVALERLPTAQTMGSGLEPPISNALMAALKRAQAHQRRGCPEQQQQPLLAVKVELEQLIISILDDPGVSRVMREASFSSPAVKATIEQSMNSSASVVNSSTIGLGFRQGSAVAAMPSRNLYLNPRLQQGGAAQSGQQKGDDVKRIVDVLMRTKKRNPVLVGELEPQVLVKDVLRRIEKKELGDGVMKNVDVIHLEKDFTFEKVRILSKVKELVDLVELRIGDLNGGGIVVDLGDLKWLVEHHSCFGTNMVQQFVAEVMRPAVAEMGKLLAKFGEEGKGRIWFVGTATCETYLRCQVYHPTMENDWDLQAMPIAARAPAPGLFPRLGTNGIPSSSVNSLSPLKGFPGAATVSKLGVSENLDPARRMGCCPQCMKNYEQELKLVGHELEQSSSDVKSESSRPPLPQWLQIAKANDADVKAKDQSVTEDRELILKQKTQDLHKKWVDICIRQHNFSKPVIAPTAPSMTSLYNPKLLAHQSFQPKLQINSKLGDILQLNTNPVLNQPTGKAGSPPGSPLKTDLVLGRPIAIEDSPEKNHKESVKDFLGCISSEQHSKNELHSDKPVGILDAESFKKLLKGLMEKVWWQREAASAVAATVTQCKIGNGKRRSGGSKGDMWLLFTGTDRVGKKKMVSALSELVCGSNPITICVGSRRHDGESELNFRGKTVLDRIVEAVRRNPFSVIMLDDIDEADMVVRGNIKRAMERGRLADSHGREVSLGNVIFILTANWLPDNLKFLSNGISVDEQKLVSLAQGGWQLRLSLSERSTKRRPNWLPDEDRATKSRKEMSSAPSFDLNEAANAEEDRADGSGNSSDLTIERQDDHGLDTRLSSSTTASAPQEILNSVDESIVFKPVDFGPIRRDIANSITKKFSSVIKDNLTIEIQDEALEKILSGVWLGRTGLEEWMEKTLVLSFHQLKAALPVSTDSRVVCIELDGNSDGRSDGDWLPSNIRVVADGL